MKKKAGTIKCYCGKKHKIIQAAPVISNETGEITELCYSWACGDLTRTKNLAVKDPVNFIDFLREMKLKETFFNASSKFVTSIGKEVATAYKNPTISTEIG